jgi:hypothetical protein
MVEKWNLAILQGANCHWCSFDNGDESGRGQPHSKTLARRIARDSFREVLECGCPLPLLKVCSAPVQQSARKMFALFPSPGFSIGFYSENIQNPLEFVVAEEGDFQGAFALRVTGVHLRAEALT